jgi:hypothetical protein
VLEEEAGVFDNEKSGGVSFDGSFGVGNSLLEPEGFGVNGDGRIGDRRDFFGAAKDIDNVDRKWNVFEAGVGFFAEDFGFVGIDGDDFVAGALEVGSDVVGRAAGVGGEADDSDGLGGAEEITDGVGGRGRVFGNVEEHDSWMNGDGQ